MLYKNPAKSEAELGHKSFPKIGKLQYPNPVGDFFKFNFGFFCSTYGFCAFASWIPTKNTRE